MPAVDQTGNSVMTAIITGNAENAEKLAEFYNIENVYGYAEYDKALNSGNFDAVYLGLPNSLHAEYMIRAAQAGIHAIVEKPLAISVAECQAMIKAAEANGTLLMTAYRLHCEPGTVEAIRLIREGAIGEPRFFTSMFSTQVAKDNHRLKAEHWGGPLQDIGVYCLNAARNVFGSEPIEALAMSGRGTDSRFTEVEEALSALLRFPGDALASFTVSFNAAEIDMYRVVGTSGYLEMSPGFHPATATRMVLCREGEITEKKFPNIDHFGAQTAYFSDCVRSGARPEPDGYEGLADVQALLAIESAAKSGLPQKIETMRRAGEPVPEMVRLIPRTDRRLVF